MTTKRSARVAHVMPGRIRLKLAEAMDPAARKEIESDLKLSPQVKHVRLTGKSLVIEHVGADEHPWSLLVCHIQRCARWSRHGW